MRSHPSLAAIVAAAATLAAAVPATRRHVDRPDDDLGAAHLRPRPRGRLERRRVGRRRLGLPGRHRHGEHARRARRLARARRRGVRRRADAPARHGAGAAVRPPLGRGPDLHPGFAAGGRDRLAVAFGSADGPALGAARTVVTDDIAFRPAFAMGPDGTGLVAWIARASGARRVVKVALRAPGGRFGAPSIIAGTGRANTVTAAVGPQGQRLVAFERDGHLFSRVREPGHDWGSVQDLGAVAQGTDNRLAALITSGGRAMLADVHRQLSEGGDAGPLLVDAWVRPVGATRFGARQRLEQADGVAASDPALVPGDGRGAVLAWAGGDPGAPATPDGPSTRVRASVTGADGRFGAAQPLSPAAQPVKAVAAAGNGSAAIVSWVRIDPASDGDGQVLAAVRPVGGAFGARRRCRRARTPRRRRPASRARPTTGRSCCGRRGPRARDRACRSARSGPSCGSPSASRELGGGLGSPPWTCASASPRRACSRRGGRSSSCSRAAATRSACSTSPRRSRVRTPCARCTSTTACAPRPTATRPHCGRCAARSASRSTSTAPRRPDDAPGNLQAWARDVRYAEAARRAAAAAARGWPRRRRPPTRPRRSSTGSRRLPVAGRCWAWRPGPGGSCARCSGSRARRPRRGAAPAPSRGARTRRTRATDTRAGACGAELVPALRAVHPAAERNVVRTAELLRDEAEVLDVVVDTALAGRDHIAVAHLAALPRALARLVVRRLAEAAAGGLCARAPGRLDDILALGEGALDLGDGARAVVDDGTLRCERTPPLPARRT